MVLFENFTVDFSVDNTGQIEFVNVLDGNINEEHSENLIKQLVQIGKIELGERSKGQMEMINSELVLDYEVCISLGEDWDDDIWEERFERFERFEIF
jgi:hypothetical protein